MTGIFVSRAPGGKPRCKRCGRPFDPRKEDDEYGPKCARKLAGQVQLDSQALVSGKVLRKKPAANISAEQGAVDAYLGAGLA